MHPPLRRKISLHSTQLKDDTPIRGLTWHDDIRETEFTCDGDAAVEDHRILPTDLFRLSPEQLQGDD